MRKTKSELNAEALPAGFEIRRGRGTRHLFLDLENKPAGLKDFIAIVSPRKKLGRIVIIEVDQKRRRRGIGTKWVRWFEEYAGRLGAIVIVCRVFPGTEHFWTRMGYEVEAPKIAGKMLRMKRVLSEP